MAFNSKFCGKLVGGSAGCGYDFQKIKTSK
jgi:hypothetical protein